MPWTIPAVMVHLTVITVLVMLFVYLYSRDRRRHMGLWAMSWALYWVKIFFALWMSLAGREPAAVVIGGHLSCLASGVLLLWGTYIFLGREMPGWWIYGSMLDAVYIVAAVFSGLPFVLVALPALVFHGLICVWTGVIFFRSGKAERPAGVVTGAAFVLFGAYKVFSPLFAGEEGLAPWDHSVAAILALIMATGTLLAALRESEARLERITDNMLDMITQTDREGVILYASLSHKEVLGYAPEDLLGKSAFEFIHPDDVDMAVAAFRAGVRASSPGKLQYRLRHADGRHLWVETTGNPFFDGNQQVAGGIFCVRDISERRRAEEETRLQRAYFQQLFQNSPEGIAMLDGAGRIVGVNKGFENIFQYSRGEAKGQAISEIVVPESLRDESASILSAVSGGETVRLESVRMRKDGSPVHVSILGYPIVVEGRQVGMYLIYTDITGRKHAEERVKYLSLYDPLTGLHNRGHFEKVMRRFQEGRCHSVGLIMCDVDGLKLVNDTLGHSAGDTLLVAAARVIRCSFPEGEVVARIGGDEFAVLLPNRPLPEVEGACQRIMRGVAEYNESHPNLPLSISAGFAVCDGGPADFDELLRKADNSMNREKLHHRKSSRSGIVKTLMKALEARDYITEGHADRLRDLVTKLALALSLSERRIADLRLLAQFHDIGKVGIPDHILFKPGRLTAGEFAEMRRHSEIGHRIAMSSPDLIPIADWILKHHEWWNGLGYPLGLKGGEIPLECRILAIADAYDAMTGHRPYREALSSREALAEIGRCSGTQFDPRLAEIFIKMLEHHFNS